MTWMLTYPSGQEHHLCGASMCTNQMHIEDIAHSLAITNRFNGHTCRPYSVAEHSLLVADLAQLEGASFIVQLAALMHDAHEAYTSDMTSPAKLVIGEPWTAFEKPQAAALHNHFGLRSTMHAHRANIRRWDLNARATERRDLTVWDKNRHQPWPILDNPMHPVSAAPGIDLNDIAWQKNTWVEWKELFIDRFHRLKKNISTQQHQAMHGAT
jgi:uncharacterized protein